MNAPTHANPLKICIIGSTYPRHEGDYAVPWLRTSVAEMVSRGHNVTILAPAYEGLRSHRIDDTEVIRFRYAPRCWERLTHEQGAPNLIRNPWYQTLAVPYVLMGCQKAWQLARRERFDVIHVHWPFPHEPMGSLAARKNGAPLVVTCHGAEFALARRKPWVGKLLRKSLQKATRIIANSSDTANKIRELSGCEATVIPFGSTVEPKDNGSANNPVPRILYTGRLIQRKGVEYLLYAVKKLLATRSVQLFITGDGDQRTRLEQLSRELGIDDAVSFLGFVDHQSLDDEYAQCDVWVNPSIIDDRGDTEGLGVGAIEAYAHGKPVVASAVGGIPDAVVHNETGLLVPEKDPQALAHAIVQVLDNPAWAKTLAVGGRRLVADRFSWQRITERTETLYAEAIRAARPVVTTSSTARAWQTAAWRCIPFWNGRVRSH